MSFCDEHGTADYCGECVYGPEIERLTAERDAAQAEAASWRRVAERLETEKQDSQAEARELRQRIDIMLCQACHDRCNTPPTGLFHSPDPEEEPCIICWLEQQSDETVKHAERADKAEAEARELRAELARVRALIGVWRRMHKAAVQVNDGHETAHHAVLKTCADQLDAALSQPAELDLSGAIRVMDKMANSLSGGDQ